MWKLQFFVFCILITVFYLTSKLASTWRLAIISFRQEKAEDMACTRHATKRKTWKSSWRVKRQIPATPGV